MAEDQTKLEIFRKVESDLADRKDWASKRIENRRLRIERKRKGAKLPYPGAPDLSEPLIDDQINDVVNSEVAILWNSRVLAQFLPLNAQALQFKAQAEGAFDAMLRLTLSVRAKLSVLFDQRKECGMSVAKMIETEVDGQALPDFLPVDPQDIVVPTGTGFLRDSERITHMIPYTEAEFQAEARKRQWNNWEAVLARATSADASENENEATARSISNDKELSNSEKQITVYEIYHRTADGKRRVTKISPAAPDVVLSEYDWEYKPIVIKGEIVHPENPAIIIQAAEIDTGGDRPWPFVQFRDEDRSLRYYNVRGAADKLADDQTEASAARQMRAILMDYGSKPFIRGDKAQLASFRWRAGEVIPPNTELVFPDPSTGSLTYNIDMARNVAARRAGAPQGALSSVNPKRDSKTATEVETLNAQAMSASGNSVERFAEPLGELFTMMWKWLKREAMTGREINLPSLSGGVYQPAAREVFLQEFIVVSGVSSRSANPMMMLQKLQTLGQFVQQFPAVQQFLKPAELARVGVDMIDPHLTETVVFDPTNGMSGAPIQMQMQQLMQAVQMISRQVQAHGQYLQSMAAEDAAGDQPQTGMEITQ